MAWIDDRIWCHPKFNPLSPQAFSSYIRGVAYSSGMSTQGRLTAADQKLVGASGKVRVELVNAGLWNMNGDQATVTIHDWEEHNGKRDARRKADRERKRQWRASAGQGADK